MKEYVYFCENCRKLGADTVDNRPFRCENCGGEFKPLHTTVDKWKTMSVEEKKETINRFMRRELPRKGTSRNRNSYKNTYEAKTTIGSQDETMDEIRAFFEKITAGEKGKNSKLAIVGFVLSFLGFFSVFGLAAGIIDLLKKDGRKKGFSIATICISVIVLICSMGLAAGSSDEATTDGIVAEASVEEDGKETLNDDNLVADSADDIKDATKTAFTEEDNIDDLIDVGDDTEIASNENTEENESRLVERTLYTTSKVNIREQPNTDCAVLGKAEKGQAVTEYEAGADGWSRVSCGGVEGYIKSEYLTQDMPSVSTPQTESAISAATESVQNTVPQLTETVPVVASIPETPTAIEPAVSVQSSGSGTFVVNLKNGKIHKVGGCSNPPTEETVYCNSYEEAEAESKRVAPNQDKRKCGNCYR